MTTGIKDFITTDGFQIEILLIPVPAFAVPYAAPKSDLFYIVLAKTRAIVTPMNPKNAEPFTKSELFTSAIYNLYKISSTLFFNLYQNIYIICYNIRIKHIR
jgi:hypothetical protein